MFRVPSVGAQRAYSTATQGSKNCKGLGVDIHMVTSDHIETILLLLAWALALYSPPFLIGIPRRPFSPFPVRTPA